MGKLLWEAIQRSTTGPMMTEEKFETELFPTVLGDLQKKYRIEFDPDEPAMIDPELADAIFEAGKELLLEVGLLCKDTQRIIKFSQEEIEEAILTARHEVTVGHGREAITLSPRAPGDRQHPYCFNAAGIITTDTQLYKQHAMTVMQEPTCDGVIPMPLFGIGGMKNIAGTPMQTQVCLTEARIMNEAAAWAGKPGLFFGIPMTSTTPHTLISTFASGLYNRHNCTLPVQILQDMRVDYDRFNLAFYADQLGLEPWMSSSPTLYASITGPEQGARQALRAAAGMQRALAQLSADLHEELPAPLQLGIGIHCGPAVVGHMGRGVATYLTAVGDTVNLASRLQDQTKHFACQLVLSAPAAKRAGLDLDLQAPVARPGQFDRPVGQVVDGSIAATNGVAAVAVIGAAGRGVTLID